MSKRAKPLPQELVEAQQQFEHWRRTRTSRSISDDLWILAIGLADRHGFSPTLRALKLNSTTFHKRIASSLGQSPLPAKPRPSKFVNTSLQETASFDPPFLATQASLPISGSPLGEGSVELNAPNGARMRIEWVHGGTPPDLLALGNALFSLQR